MQPFFYFDTEKTRKSLLSRARNVTLWAMQQYEVAWNCIRFIGLSDTLTYKIETDTTQNYLLRIHSESVNKEEVLSELTFLRELAKIEGLIVPEGIKARNGSYVLEGTTDEGYRKPLVSLMTWVEGEHWNGAFTDDYVYHIGVMMGNLHEASTCMDIPEDFVRPCWGSASFKQDVSKLERYYSRFLTEESWKLYQQAINKIIQQVDRMQRANRNYGLIHADLHTGNIVCNNGSPYPIDFGRSGYGYYLYDMAASLLALSPNHRQLLIQGYESVRVLEQDYVHDLACFFIMVMIGNYCHHVSDVTEVAGLINEQKYALAYIHAYINDSEFLFNRLEPVAMADKIDVENEG